MLGAFVNVLLRGPMGLLSDMLRRLGWAPDTSAEDRPASSVLSTCSAISQRLAKAGIDHAVIGGLALGAHRYVRATTDVDMLIDAAREDEVNAMMKELDFEVLHRTEDLSNYLLEYVRVDFIHARRPYARAMLERADRRESFGLAVPIATVEDIIALKLQARHSNPARTQDTADIERLIEYNVESLDVEYLRQFFRMFDCEAELDELLKP